LFLLFFGYFCNLISRLPFVIHAIIHDNFFGLFLATFCDHFLASFGEQFGYKILLHLATLPPQVGLILLFDVFMSFRDVYAKTVK